MVIKKAREMKERERERERGKKRRELIDSKAVVLAGKTGRCDAVVVNAFAPARCKSAKLQHSSCCTKSPGVIHVRVHSNNYIVIIYMYVVYIRKNTELTYYVIIDIHNMCVHGR